jgi:hypothetical protein
MFRLNATKWRGFWWLGNHGSDQEVFVQIREASLKGGDEMWRYRYGRYGEFSEEGFDTSTECHKFLMEKHATTQTFKEQREGRWG